MVYLVDDDRSVLKALKRLFGVAGFRFQAFATAHDFLNHRELASPCCLVLDVELPDQSGLDLQKEISNRGWGLAIVFITGHGNIPMAVEAMRSGAIHFLAKPFDNQDLLAAVRQAIDQDRQLNCHLQENLQMEARVALLTPREHEVFALVTAGMANKNIAARLRLSLPTVKLHRGRVMKKLQVDSVADLVRLAEKVKSTHSQPAASNRPWSTGPSLRHRVP
jgi:FixJ family two-component response regulator